MINNRKKNIAIGLIIVTLAGMSGLLLLRDNLHIHRTIDKIDQFQINNYAEESVGNEEENISNPLEQMTENMMFEVIQGKQPLASGYDTNLNVRSISEIENFDYILLVREEIEYGASFLIPSYFLFAKEYDSWVEGEEAYYKLQDKLLHRIFEEKIWCSNYWNDMKQGLIDYGYEKRLDAEILIDISSDGENCLTFECKNIDEPWSGTVCVYNQATGKKISEWKEVNYQNICIFSDSCFGAYIQRGQDNRDYYYLVCMEKNKQEKILDEQSAKKYKNIILNRDCTYFAANQDGNIIIYNIVEGNVEFGFTGIELLQKDSIVLHQFQGDSESGFILFSSGIRTYKLTYPDKIVEIMGDYLFYPSISPNEKYLFYTGISDSILEDFGWTEELMKIPQAVYVKELDTGNVYGIEGLKEGWNSYEFGVRWLEK